MAEYVYTTKPDKNIQNEALREAIYHLELYAETLVENPADFLRLVQQGALRESAAGVLCYTAGRLQELDQELNNATRGDNG